MTSSDYFADKARLGLWVERHKSGGSDLKQNNAAQHALLRGSRSRCLCCRNRSEKPVHNVLTGFSRSFISCARRHATAPDWSVTRHASTNGVRGNYRLLPPRRSVLVAASLVEFFRNTGWAFLGQVARIHAASRLDRNN